MEVKIHSKIVERGPASVKLWYYAAAHNLTGCSKVILDLAKATTFFGVTERSILGWLSNRTFFYPQSCKSRGLLVLYPRARNKVCMELGLSDWGTTAIIPVEGIIEIKKSSTLAVAVANQRASKYAIHKQNKGKAKYLSFINPEPVKPSYKARGVNYSNKGNLFIDGTKLTPWGGTQSHIAESISRSQRTVSRRLKEVNKIQQWYHKPLYDEEFARWEHVDEFGAATYLGTMYKYKDKVYKRHTLLYTDDVRLTSMKMARAKFKKFLKLD